MGIQTTQRHANVHDLMASTKDFSFIAGHSPIQKREEHKPPDGVSVFSYMASHIRALPKADVSRAENAGRRSKI